jgi:hypothetical protein
MWRVARIGLLLFVLAVVAQNCVGRALAHGGVEAQPARRDLSDRRRCGGNERTLHRRVAEGCVRSGRGFFPHRASKYDVPLADPVEVFLAPAILSTPPAAPFGGNALRIVWWSLELRAWAWWNDTYKGAKPDVRLFVLYHDPVAGTKLPHSTGLQKGLIGVVNAVADGEYEGSNNVVIAHELLHTLGATDKYDPDGNRPTFPDGYADPQAIPRLPQRRAEIMAGRIPISETQAEMPRACGRW